MKTTVECDRCVLLRETLALTHSEVGRLKTQRDEMLARAEINANMANAYIDANSALRAELARKTEALESTRAKLAYPSWKSETEYLRVIDQARAVVDSALAEPKAGGESKP